MLTAYRDAFRRYATFAGRSTRSQYWLYSLTVILLLIVLAIIDVAVLGFDPDEALPLAGIANLVHFVPSLAVLVRRLHDSDRSGWTALIFLIPIIGQVALIVFLCLPSTPGPNRFGAAPGGGHDTKRTENTRPRGSQAPTRASGAAGTAATDRDPALDHPDTSRQPASSGNLVAELRQLADLKAQGALDEAEFQRLKADLMARGSGAA